MGKIYTFIHKDKVNKKVKTSELNKYLDNGWSLGNWNQKELNQITGAGVRKFNDTLRNLGKMGRLQ